MKHYTDLKNCLACGSDDLHPYLNLGSQPPANQFVTEHNLPKYPLGLQVCGSCFHSQLIGAVDPKILFTDYPYVSGTSASLRQYFTHFVRKVEIELDVAVYTTTAGTPQWVEHGLRILEIGSNDGTLLSIFKQRGHTVLGVDPATNLMSAAKANGVETVNAFFDKYIALPGTYDVIIMMNVLAHTADPLDMLETAKRYLAPGGRIYVQTSQAHMLRDGQFDTVYHEHVSFFTAQSFSMIAARTALYIDRISYVDVHGTSYLVEMVDQPVAGMHNSNHIPENENLQGYYSLNWYKSFQVRASLVADHAMSTVQTHRDQGYRIVGYGAAAKGVVFLSATQMDLDFVIDDNPLKIGRLIPGRNIHVASREAMQFNGRALWVITAWNMKDEIIAKIKAVRPNEDDRFLVYFPSVEVTP